MKTDTAMITIKHKEQFSLPSSLVFSVHRKKWLTLSKVVETRCVTCHLLVYS